MGGFLGGLSEGFGTAVGQRQDAAEARKQQMINEQRETSVHGFQQAGQQIQQKLATIDPNDQTPEVAQNRADLQAALEHINQQTTDLFHPSKDPGALQHLGQLISQHVLGHQHTPAVAAQTPAMTASTPATAPPAAPLQGDSQPVPTGVGAPTTLNLPGSTGPAVAGPNPPPPTAEQLRQQVATNLSRVQALAAAPTPGTALTPEEQHKAAMVQHGLAPKAINYRPLRPTDKPFNIPGVGVRYVNVDDPDAQDKILQMGGSAVIPAMTPKQSQAAMATHIRAMFGDNPTQAQWLQGENDWLKRTHPNVASEHDQVVYDSTGNAFTIAMHGSSQRGIPDAPTPAGNAPMGQQPASGAPPAAAAAPAVPPAPKLTADTTQLAPAASPAVPASPAKLRAQAKSGAARVSAPTGGGSALKPIPTLHKNTPDQTKAQEDLSVATKLDSQANQLAANPNNPIAQKQLALALIKGAAGRVNMNEYDIFVKNNGLGNTLEGWANNAASGALPTEVVNRLIDAAHRNLQASKDAQDESMKGANGYTPHGGSPVTVNGFTFDNQAKADAFLAHIASLPKKSGAK